MNKLYNNKGYTLLFAAITAALVLGVAVFILSVSRKQYILASTARDSMFSIYSADSGIECIALRNNDLSANGIINENPADRISSSTVASGFELKCNEGTFAIEPKSYEEHPSFKDGSDTKQASGYIYTGYGGVDTCAQITVTTGKDSNGDKRKVFDVRGYNLCEGSGNSWQPIFGSPRTVERALRLTYKGVW